MLLRLELLPELIFTGGLFSSCRKMRD
jgi:hypothetical protein